MEGFGKYLGVPSVFSRNKTKDFGYILDKMWKSVQGWKKSFFSLARKEVLIKSIGQVIPSYVMNLSFLRDFVRRSLGVLLSFGGGLVIAKENCIGVSRINFVCLKVLGA